MLSEMKSEAVVEMWKYRKVVRCLMTGRVIVPLYKGKGFSLALLARYMVG